MARPLRKRPTDAELEILRVLWAGGPSTVRQVLGRLNETRETGYTTVLKLMQIMTEKSLLVRDTNVRPQVYRAARTQGQTQRLLLGLRRLAGQPRGPGALDEEGITGGAGPDPPASGEA